MVPEVRLELTRGCPQGFLSAGKPSNNTPSTSSYAVNTDNCLCLGMLAFAGHGTPWHRTLS